MGKGVLKGYTLIVIRIKLVQDVSNKIWCIKEAEREWNTIR